MRFDILSLFPGIFESPLAESILGRALAAGHIQVQLHDIREWAEGKHRVCDDAPYGGGDGMVMKPEPLAKAISAVQALEDGAKVILFTPQGRTFNQQMAGELAAERERLILVCCRYAGVDERILDKYVDLELSIGDYVLSGGEIPALAVVEAVSRLIPGVLGNEDSPENDSFPARLEYSQYTRPAQFEGLAVPEILLSGHHAQVERWRKKDSLRRTRDRRPDLLELFPPDEDERELLQELDAEDEV